MSTTTAPLRSTSGLLDAVPRRSGEQLPRSRRRRGRAWLLAVCSMLLAGGGWAPAADDLVSDLVLRMTLDQSSGTTVSDSAGSHTGTFQGAPTWTGSGQIDGALDFDGTDDYVTCADADDLDHTSALTIAFWFRTDSVTGINGLCAKRVNHNNNNSWGIYLDGNVVKVDLDGTGDRWSSSATFSTGTWRHLVVVYDGSLTSTSRAKLYVDGSLDVTRTESSSSLPNNSSGVCIGRLCANSSSFFDGRLDEMRIYRRALTGSEVSALYAFSGPVEPSDTWRHLRLSISDLITESLSGRITELNYLVGATSHPTTAMTSNSSGGMVADASTDTTNAYLAFDNSTGTQWSVSQASLPAWVTLDLGSGNGIAPDAVEILCGQDFRCPEDFTIEGSNDGSTWTELLTVTGAGGNCICCFFGKMRKL